MELQTARCTVAAPHRRLLLAPLVLLGNSGWAVGEASPHAAVGGWATQEAAALLAVPGLPCARVHEALLWAVARGEEGTVEAKRSVFDKVPELLEQLELSEDGTPYAVLFGDVTRAVQLALEIVQMLSLAAMMHKRCLSSSARLALGRSLLPLQRALQQQVSTMWWMFDIGSYSNTNSPVKHLEAVVKIVQPAEAVFRHLAAELPLALASAEHFWGHGAHGMFVNSTVIYRALFPESAILDKGLLRGLLRLLPQGVHIADFGALDGQYAKWLNDTGWVTAFAFDGVEGVAELTGGAVSQVDLAEQVLIPWRSAPFDWVLCLEVAEHIPPEREEAFLGNLAHYANDGLVLSWAPPGIEGEGHVNCLPLEDSRAKVEALGFAQDERATAALRTASGVPWIGASVAVYRRLG